VHTLVQGAGVAVPDAGLATGSRTSSRQGTSPRLGLPTTSIPEQGKSFPHLNLPHLGMPRPRWSLQGARGHGGLLPRKRRRGHTLPFDSSSSELRTSALPPHAPRIPPPRTHPGANLVLFCPPSSRPYPRRTQGCVRPPLRRRRRGLGEHRGRATTVRDQGQASKSLGDGEGTSQGKGGANR